MTKRDIVDMLSAAWILYGLRQAPQEEDVLAWHSVIGHLPREVVEKAFRLAVATSPYPPKPADILKWAADFMDTEQMDDVTALTLINNAVRAFGAYNPERGIESLPERLREVVRAIGWNNLCICEQPEVLRAQILKLLAACNQRAHKHFIMEAMQHDRTQKLQAPTEAGKSLPAPGGGEAPKGLSGFFGKRIGKPCPEKLNN